MVSVLTWYFVVGLLPTTLILNPTVEGAIAGKNDKCWCEQQSGCHYVSSNNRDSRSDSEVIVVSNGSSTTGVWKWDSITTVITTYTSEARNNNKIACESHNRGKKYGFIMPLPTMVNDSFLDSKEWVDIISKRKRLWYADIVVVDMIDALKNPTEKALDSLDRLLDSLHDSEDWKTVQDGIYCLLPWTPPTCSNSSCKVIQRLLGHCQTHMLGPDSYLDASDERRCEAVPTIPFTEFIYGIEQYLNLKIFPNPHATLVAGIPWHGFEYTCVHYGEDGRCPLKKDEKCDITKQRQRKSLAEIHEQIRLKQNSEKVDELTQAAYYSFQDKAQIWHTLWFENHQTLSRKYEMVNVLNIKGLSLWTAEDLAQGFSVEQLTDDVNMWDWVMHAMIHKAVSNPPQITHYYADTVAGAAIGCLLLGTALGITFTCIALRQCKRSPPKRPFKLDENVEDFHDDPGL